MRAFDPREAAVPVGKAGNVQRRTSIAAVARVGNGSAQRTAPAAAAQRTAPAAAAQRTAPAAAADQTAPGQQSFDWSQGVPLQHLPLSPAEEQKLDKVDKELKGHLRLLRTKGRVVYFKHSSGHYRSYEAQDGKPVLLLHCAEPHRLHEALAGRETVPGERRHHSNAQCLRLIAKRQDKVVKRALDDATKQLTGLLQRMGSSGEAANARATALEQELAAAQREAAAAAAAAQEHADLAQQEQARCMKLGERLERMEEEMRHLHRRAKHAEHAAETARSRAEGQLEGLQNQIARLQGHLEDVQVHNGMLQDQLGAAWWRGSLPAAKRLRPNHSHQRR